MLYRYGEFIQASYTTTLVGQQTNEDTVEASAKKQSMQLGTGKKIKRVINKSFASKVTSNNLTLTETEEDTCGDDFFSTHVQKSNDTKVCK